MKTESNKTVAAKAQPVLIQAKKEQKINQTQTSNASKSKVVPTPKPAPVATNKTVKTNQTLSQSGSSSKWAIDWTAPEN